MVARSTVSGGMCDRNGMPDNDNTFTFEFREGDVPDRPPDRAPEPPPPQVAAAETERTAEAVRRSMVDWVEEASRRSRSAAVEPTQSAPSPVTPPEPPRVGTQPGTTSTGTPPGGQPTQPVTQAVTPPEDPELLEGLLSRGRELLEQAAQAGMMPPEEPPTTAFTENISELVDSLDSLTAATQEQTAAAERTAQEPPQPSAMTPPDSGASRLNAIREVFAQSLGDLDAATAALKRLGFAAADIASVRQEFEATPPQAAPATPPQAAPATPPQAAPTPEPPAPTPAPAPAPVRLSSTGEPLPEVEPLPEGMTFEDAEFAINTKTGKAYVPLGQTQLYREAYEAAAQDAAGATPGPSAAPAAPATRPPVPAQPAPAAPPTPPVPPAPTPPEPVPTLEIADTDPRKMAEEMLRREQERKQREEQQQAAYDAYRDLTGKDHPNVTQQAMAQQQKDTTAAQLSQMNARQIGSQVGSTFGMGNTGALLGQMGGGGFSAAGMGAMGVAVPVGMAVAAYKEAEEKVMQGIRTVGGATADIARLDTRAVSERFNQMAENFGTGGRLVAEFNRALTAVSDGLSETARKLAPYSGTLAAAQGQAEVTAVQGDIRRAQQLGPELAKFVEARAKLEQLGQDALAKIIEPVIPVITQMLEMQIALLERLVGNTNKDVEDPVEAMFNAFSDTEF